MTGERLVVVRNLEACVEELRADVVSGKSQVVLADVEAMVLALGHIGRSLASLRGYTAAQFSRAENEQTDRLIVRLSL